MVKKQFSNSTLPNTPTEYDNRLNWLKNVTESSLKEEFHTAKNAYISQQSLIQQLKNDEIYDQATLPAIPEDIFAECLERNARNHLQTLVNFLDDNCDSSTVLFWTEKVSHKCEVPYLPVVTEEEIAINGTQEDTPKTDEQSKSDTQKMDDRTAAQAAAGIFPEPNFF